MDRTNDLESHYSPLAGASPNVSFPRIVAVAVVSVFLLAAGILLNPSVPAGEAGGIDHEMVRRGVDEGVSEKSNGMKGERRLKWSRDELSWQRTGFHFQPEKNWMNDPNGPVYYKGWYHLFYQYNPDSAVWGNITWGHAVSRDLIHWLYLPLAMVQDRWYDINGVWTGSATILPDGKVVMLYTGSTNDSTQVQNLAFPDDHSDPLLLKWIKYESNPVLFPPEGIDKKDFRDPTTAWFVPSENVWRTAIGSKNANGTGITLVYQTRDFINYDLLPGFLHGVPETGMWECVDFFPVAAKGDNGLDTSENGPGVKHVLKASFDDDRNDYYAIGTYDPVLGTWVPDDPEADVGLRFRYDYGKFYAAKTFYDQERRRRVLWGWIAEADSELADVAKGWASLLGIPRAVRLDEKTRTNLIQWPVKEVDDLRLGHTNFSDIKVGPGSVVPLNVGQANQLDINVEFEVSKAAMAAVVKSSASYNCTSSKGAAENGVLGPFGLLVLSDMDRTEQTAVYFYVGNVAGGKLTTFVCHDELRSSRANDIIKGIHGSPVPILNGEKLSLRVLVDHSIVETFAQGGRTCITSRVYPTKAIYGAARIFLFNNATNTPVTARSVKVWEMNSAFLRPFDFTKD